MCSQSFRHLGEETHGERSCQHITISRPDNYCSRELHPMMTEKDFELVRGMIEGFESIKAKAAKRSKNRTPDQTLSTGEDCAGEVPK